MKRIGSVLLIVILVLSLCPLTVSVSAADPAVWDGTTASAFAGGDGSETTPYLISTPAEWAYFAAQVTGGTTYSGKYIQLTADLVFNTGDSSGWEETAPANTTPSVGTDGKPFSGIFDGQGHTVSGFYMNSTGDGTAVFGECKGTSISNLIVANSFIQCKQWAGILVGEASGSVTIANCYIAQNAILSSSSGSVGGFIGGCYGAWASSDVAQITDSVFAGTIKANGSYVGGFIGNGNSSSGKIHKNILVNCLTIGTLDVAQGFVCGFIGGNGSISTSWAEDLVTFTGCVYAGGADGYNAGGSNCYPFTCIGKSGAVVTGCYSNVSGNNYKALDEVKSVDRVLLFDLWGSDAAVTVSGWTKRADDIMIPTGIASFAPASGLPVPVASLADRLEAIEPATAFAGGEGTSDSPYQISNAAELQFFANSVSEGETYAGKYFILTENITFNTTSAAEWKTTAPANKFLSVGQSADAYFAGDFDGNGKTISGLCIVDGGTKDGGIALFAGIQSGANVHDFLLDNSCVLSESGSDQVAAIVANIDLTDAEKSATVANVYVNDVRVEGAGNSGGIVGQILTSELTVAADAKIVGSVFAGTVTSSGDNVGGILGNCNAATGVSVVNCLNLGAVSGSSYVSGIVARADAGVKVANCVNAGTVTAAGSGYAADLFVAGKNVTTGKTTLENCYYIGTGKKAFYNNSGKDESDGTLDYTARGVKLYALWAESTLPLDNWVKRTEGTGDIVIPAGVAAFAPASGLDVPEKPEDPKPKEPLTPVTTEKKTETTPVGTEPASTEGKGCGSVIGGSLAALLLFAGAGAVLVRKKEY